MPTYQQFPLPDAGEGLTEAEIVEWRVAPGDVVSVNQTIVEIETAKSLVEPAVALVRGGQPDPGRGGHHGGRGDADHRDRHRPVRDGGAGGRRRCGERGAVGRSAVAARPPRAPVARLRGAGRCGRDRRRARRARGDVGIRAGRVRAGVGWVRSAPAGGRRGRGDESDRPGLHRRTGQHVTGHRVCGGRRRERTGGGTRPPGGTSGRWGERQCRRGAEHRVVGIPVVRCFPRARQAARAQGSPRTWASTWRSSRRPVPAGS